MANTNTDSTPQTAAEEIAAIMPGAEFLPEKPAAQVEPKADETVVDDPDPEAGGDPDPDPEAVVEKETKTGDEPEAFDKSKSSDELIADFQHRIGRVTAKRKDAEDALADTARKLQEKEAEIATLKQNPPAAIAPTPDNPLANVESLEALQKRMEDAAYWQQKAIREPEGFTVGEGDDAITLDAEQVRDLQAKSTAILTTHGPKRAQYLAAVDGKTAETKTVYPTLFDEKSEDYQEAQNLLKHWPEVKRFPDFMEVLGHYITGRKATEAALKATAGKPEGAKPPAKKIPLAPPGPKPGGGGATVPANQITKGNAAAAVIEGGGSKADLENYFDR